MSIEEKLKLRQVEALEKIARAMEKFVNEGITIYNHQNSPEDLN